MKKIAVVGGGISGLSSAQLLKDQFQVKLFEKASRPGGLIKCDIVNGNLYHMVGGHVFNSKREDVLEFFWKFFDREIEFTKSIRNAVVQFDKPVSYPIENHLDQFDPEITQNVIRDLISLKNKDIQDYDNFEEFLIGRFGETLYNLYFKPYNEKIWKQDLSKVPLEWLEGKLPMPSVEQILFDNIKKKEESNMVHSTFYYPIKEGSQFLADRLAREVDIEYDAPIETLEYLDGKWLINQTQEYDIVVYSGNIKMLPKILRGNIINKYTEEIGTLDSHGTTTVLVEIDSNDYSWIYLPNIEYDAHRIICTGNFAKSNNAPGILSATLEFTGSISKNDILEQLKKVPLSPKYIAHQYTEYTYPTQNKNTRHLISSLKGVLEKNHMYLVGRFAEWEYFNMDAAIGSAIDTAKRIIADND